MGVIKGVLKEELNNSLKMKKSYDKALRELPVGALYPVKRRKKVYYYLKVRVKDKVKNIYKGNPSAKEIKKYENAKIMRKKYRNLLSKVKKQIKYLKGVLRGKESI
ncbi:MAG: hypothetical protein WCJ94_07220 [bacterium]